MKIIAISDTHNKHKTLGTLPECDLLIHAGDATGQGRESEIKNFAQWFHKQPAKHKIFVPGNHEKEFENNLPASLLWFTEHCPGAHVLINESITINGLKIYGSPVTPYFLNWAWNEHITGLQKAWATIPTNTDILITHGPAYGILDTTFPGNKSLGCLVLLKEIQERVLPKIHICGHIHGGYGKATVKATTHYNVSICNEMYQPINPITVVD